MPQGHAPQKSRISVAAVMGSHGVRGNVKIKPFTETPESLGRFDKVYLEDGQQVSLKILSVGSKGVVLARLGKVESRDASDALRGQHLYVDRAALPDLADDEIYHADLLGLDAVLADGRALGRIAAIHDFGAGNVVEIEPPQGASVMLPFGGAALVAIELDKGQVVLAPPDGLLDGAEDATNNDAGVEKEKN
ncbi:MAG: ribosome maturation factor RimM [Candidatus Puniceispirillum sp.]